MLTIFGSEMCPDCVKCKEDLDAKNIAYDFRDITVSLMEMHEFMKLRDVNEAFDPIRGTGTIGIPAIVKEDGSVILDWSELVQ